MELYVKQQQRFSLDYMTPVVHTVNLGRLNLSNAYPMVEVVVIDQSTMIPLLEATRIHRDDADDDTMSAA